MKKAKKMLLAASALALVSFGFGGCSGEEIGDEIINVTKNSAKEAAAEINEVNSISTGSKASYLRNFVPVKYKHTEALCRITMSKPGISTVKGSSNSNGDWIKDETKKDSASYASVMGFGFNDQEASGKSNLYIVGVRIHPTTNKPQAYVSYFEGVTGEDFNNGSSFGTEYGWNGSSWVTSKGITGTSSDFVDLDSSLYNASTNVLDLYVGVMYDKTSKKYTVSIIKPSDTVNAIKEVDSTQFGAAVTGGQKLLDGVPLKNADNGAEGYIGFYANVAPDANLIGTWNKTASKDAEIAEAE
ncbi:MAG: hypothetical protein K2J81_03540 [Treponemataceae bacterium]|nr:hypothetical protein [Treponemataceae bacterium]